MVFELNGIPGGGFAFLMAALFFSLACGTIFTATKIQRSAVDVGMHNSFAVTRFLWASVPLYVVRCVTFALALLYKTNTKHGHVGSVYFICLWISPKDLKHVHPLPSVTAYSTAWVLWCLGIWLFFVAKTLLVLVWAYLVESHGRPHRQVLRPLLLMAVFVNTAYFVSFFVSVGWQIAVYSHSVETGDFHHMFSVFQWTNLIPAIFSVIATTGFAVYGTRVYFLHRRIMSHASVGSRWQRAMLVVVVLVCMLSFTINAVWFVLDNYLKLLGDKLVPEHSAEVVCCIVFFSEVLPAAFLIVLLKKRTDTEFTRLRRSLLANDGAISPRGSSLDSYHTNHKPVEPRMNGADNVPYYKPPNAGGQHIRNP